MQCSLPVQFLERNHPYTLYSVSKCISDRILQTATIFFMIADRVTAGLGVKKGPCLRQQSCTDSLFLALKPCICKLPTDIYMEVVNHNFPCVILTADLWTRIFGHTRRSGFAVCCISSTHTACIEFWKHKHYPITFAYFRVLFAK